MEELDSSKKKEKYARKSFEENRDQDERIYRPDFIKRDLFSNVIPTVWNNKNVAYSSHNKRHSDYYWGSQKYDDSFNENSVSTRTSSRRRLSTCVVVAWLVIGLLIIAAGGVTIYFVYFTNSSNNDPTTTTVPSTTSGPYELLWFIGDITIYNNSWDPDLLNKSSQKCQEMMENVTVMIDAVYKASTLKVVYIKSTVQGFRRGSTVADVILSFAISPEFREVLDAGLVNTAFQEVVKNGSVEETKQFDIDTAIINFADFTPTEPTTTTTEPSTTTTEPSTTTTEPTTTITEPSTTTTEPTTTTTEPTTTTTEPTTTTTEPSTTTTEPSTTTTEPSTTTTEPTTTTTEASTTTTEPTTTTTEPTTTITETTTTTTTITPPNLGTCGGHFTSLTGSFASPNYPGDYPNNADCTYTIIVPVDHYITLSFQTFNTEFGYDYVKVYDGWSNSHPQLRSISGSLGSNIVPVVSSSNSLFVWFTSNGYFQRQGFSANYESRIIEPGNVTCDFEQSSGCDYVFDGPFVWREGYIHHLPSIDHTIGNESGHYMYFTSSSREVGILTSPHMNTTSGGCLYFYYNMEGGPSVELKIYIQAGVNKTMTFYANGIDMKTDQWKKGWFNIPPGRTELFFLAYGDIYYLKPSIVAIDDIFFDEGTSCPASPNCSDNGLFGCETSGVCIPQYLTTDGYSDCYDASDESVNTTDTSPQTNETWISRCTFESPEDDSCLFSNDVSGIDDADWRINSGPTRSSNTGPSNAAVGANYLYIETSENNMLYGDFAYYISSAMNFNSSLCMSFYYHMYGTSIGSLEVIAYSSAGTQVLFSQSSDQGNNWYYQDVHIANLDNVKIIFNATDGGLFQGDIAIDHILLFLNQCEVLHLEPKVRLVGGRDQSSGRLEIKLPSATFYRPVCTTYWDEDDTKVVCRELGYSNFRLLKLSEYGKGRIGRSTFRNQFHCNGDEEKLSDCVGTTAYSCPGEIVAIQCSNSHCFDGEISCGDGNLMCIEEKNWCDGNFDCPNFADEHTCGHCNDTEFECNNHQCITAINRCDGTPQCDDKSDEFRCVIKDDDSDQVHVYKDNRWAALCYSDDLTLAEYLCSITGFGLYLTSSKGGTISNGLTAVPSDNPHGIITNYWLQDTVTCNSLDLLCGDIECGVSTVLPRSTSAGSYILFGNDAINGEWPWQALFFEDSYSICGAVLIDPLWALTAAHCVQGGGSYSIHVGEVKESEMGNKGQRLSVAEVIAHENYKGSSNSYSNDIALLRLSSKAIFNDFVRPACIGTNIHSHYDYCYITGWGYTHYETWQGIAADNLKEVQVDMNTDVDRCNKSILANLNVHVPGNGICLENKNPYSPACHGDSGGPLVCLNNKGRWELLGITSFGVPGCFTDQIPAIYQSVPHNSDWIAQHTGLNLTIPRQPTKPPA